MITATGASTRPANSTSTAGSICKCARNARTPSCTVKARVAGRPAPVRPGAAQGLQGNTMTDEPKADWTDAQIVQHIRDCAIEYSTCGFNTIRANRIMDKELRPSYEVLRRKGHAALRKLLPLLNDANSTVQRVAAGFCYDI